MLLEIGNAFARKRRQEAVQVIDRFLSADEVEVVHLTPELFKRAFDLYKSFPDKTWSLVDCISFIVMAQMGITRALTCDQHFVQAGMQALMRENSC